MSDFLSPSVSLCCVHKGICLQISYTASVLRSCSAVSCFTLLFFCLLCFVFSFISLSRLLCLLSAVLPPVANSLVILLCIYYLSLPLSLIRVSVFVAVYVLVYVYGVPLAPAFPSLGSCMVWKLNISLACLLSINQLEHPPPPSHVEQLSVWLHSGSFYTFYAPSQ